MHIHTTILNKYKLIKDKLFLKGVIGEPISKEFIIVDGVRIELESVINYLKEGELITIDEVDDVPEEEDDDGVILRFSNCEFCGEDLPQEEISMGAANHRDCWERHIFEQKLLKGVKRDGHVAAYKVRF